MSYEIVKSIVFKKDKVFVSSTSNNVSPRRFNSWECTRLSKMLQEEGREAVLAQIGEHIWDGNWQLQNGSKLCKLFLDARHKLPPGLTFHNFDSKAAGKYLGKAVVKLELDPWADLSGDVKELLALRNDKNHILEASKREGYNFLNYASEEVQQDRALAKELIHCCGDRAWFDFPKHFANDKELVLEGLKFNGCLYRDISDDLKGDREVIWAAFSEFPKKRFHEHLPDLIPESALYIADSNGERTPDTAFICDLIEKCPSMHLERCPWMVENRDIALKWCEVGKFFPHSVTNLSDELVGDIEFQKVLVSRFDGTDKLSVLKKLFAERGIELDGPLGLEKRVPLEHLISSASEKVTDKVHAERAHTVLTRSVASNADEQTNRMELELN